MTPTRSASEATPASEAVPGPLRAQPRWRVGLVLLALAAFVASAALAAAPGSLPFVVHTADGANFTGKLEELKADGSVRLGGVQSTTVRGNDIVSVRRANLHLPAYPKENVVIFTHGDRISFDPAKSIKMADGRLGFFPRTGLRDQAVSIPRAFIALVWLGDAGGGSDQDLAIQRLLAGKRKQDVLLLRNGDQVEGAVAGVEPGKSVSVETGARKLDLPLGQVTAIAFNTELQARIRFPKIYTHAVLTNGCRLSFSSLQLERGAARVTGKTLLGVRGTIAVGDIAALERRGERIVYLSDLKPASFENTPFSGLTWSLSIDSAVTGRPLRLAGSTHDKGIGMHTRSKVAYHLDGKFRWFEATVGLDENSGRLGRARVHVYVDGKERPLGLDKELGGTDPPLGVRVDVEGARELTLTADFGSYGDVQGHVDWADARLIR